MVGAVLASAAFGSVVVVSSLRDRQHSLWRDPLSFFGSDEAVAPTAFAVSLVLAGVAIGWLGIRTRHRPTGVGLVAIGAGATVLALIPIDCSPVDDVCELIVRAGADSVSHDLHGIIGLGFHLAVFVTSGVAAFHRSGHRSPTRTALLAAAVAVTALPLLMVSVRPFGPGLGAAQILSFSVAAGIVATRVAADSHRPEVPH